MSLKFSPGFVNKFRATRIKSAACCNGKYVGHRPKRTWDRAASNQIMAVPAVEKSRCRINRRVYVPFNVFLNERTLAWHRVSLSSRVFSFRTCISGVQTASHPSQGAALYYILRHGFQIRVGLLGKQSERVLRPTTYFGESGSLYVSFPATFLVCINRGKFTNLITTF